MSTASKPRIVVLGAGFGGLELATLLSEALGDSIDVTLIDKSDSPTSCSSCSTRSRRRSVSSAAVFS